MVRVTKLQGVVGVAIWGDDIVPETIFLQGMRRLNPACDLPVDVFGAWRSEANHASALQKAGLSDVYTKRLRVRCQFNDTDEFITWAFHAQNPVPTIYVKHWEAQGGDALDLKDAMAEIAEEEYAEATNLYFDVVLGWGRRADRSVEP
jgi:hypothetical protein